MTKRVRFTLIIIAGIISIMAAGYGLNKSVKPERTMVQMVVTASYTHPDTRKRITEVWMDSKESVYVCAQMLAFSSYEDEKVETRNFIDIDCFNSETGAKIEYLTKENLFPKGTEPKVGAELKNFLKGFGENI